MSVTYTMPVAGLVALRGCPLSPGCPGQRQEWGSGSSAARTSGFTELKNTQFSSGIEAGQGRACVSCVTQPGMRSGCIAYELQVCASLPNPVFLFRCLIKKSQHCRHPVSHWSQTSWRPAAGHGDLPLQSLQLCSGLTCSPMHPSSACRGHLQGHGPFQK